MLQVNEKARKITYNVAFDDGAEPEEDLPPDFITPISEPEKVPYQIGEKVYRLANPMLTGHVVKCHGTVKNNDLSYDVDYDDKSKEYKVLDNLLAPKVPHPLLMNKDDKVMARSPKREEASRRDDGDTTNPMQRNINSGYRKASLSDPKDEEDEPLLAAEDREAREKAQEDQESKDMISSLKAMTGLWPEVDPPDCEWMKLEQIDKSTGDVTPKGEICYSIQIWPKDKALVMKAGAARSEPNTNPYLPPPVGRLKWSWNPFVLGSELCGPMLCAKFFCCIMCIAFVLLMVFCQPFLTLMINIIFFFGR